MTLTDKPRIGVIIGSARDARFADKPANWFVDLASARVFMPDPALGKTN